MVAKGELKVPGLVSLPFVATYNVCPLVGFTQRLLVQESPSEHVPQFLLTPEIVLVSQL